MKKFLNPELIILDAKSSNKDDLLNELAALFTEKKYALDKNSLLISLKKREQQDPTLIHNQIAMPHAKCETIKKTGVIVARTASPIIWNSSTKEKAQLFFMLGLPEHEHNLHLDIISSLSRILSDEIIIQKLMHAKTTNEIITLLNQSDISKPDSKSKLDIIDIVAVTACPTGIAHTYMAADALKNEALKKGLSIRVETNGADGAKDILTDKEISDAKVVIIAADREVDLSKYDGKKLYRTSAGDAVRNPAKTIDQALKIDIPTYKHFSQEQNTESNKKGIYGQLMTGVSYMLPFVVGGGILIALGFMFGITASDPNAPDYNPIADFLNTLGGAGAFSLMIPVLAAYIGFSIGERPALMPAMVGGSLAASNGGGFLGGLLAGFVGGYIILLLKKVFSYLPKTLEGLKPVLFYPVFGLLLMGIIVMPLLSHISDINKAVSLFLESLSGINLIFLGFILGGMMAIDMGGPINKAAFTFGIAAISAGNLYPHAAVMAGGMVPPLGIALATTFAKNLFTPAEQEAGLTCYALGASFITEGAIPFAASNPLIIIPSSILGSATSGALSMMFGCQLPAPHGGIFVFPLISNVQMYILSILIGSAITAGSIIVFLSRKLKKTS